MNVLIIEYHASPDAGGAEASMWTLFQHLQDRHKVLLATSANSQVADAPDVYRASTRLPLEALTVSSLPGFLLALFQLVILVRKEEIDVVFTHVNHVSPLLRVLSWFTGCRYAIYYKWVGTMQDVGAKIKWGNRSASAAMSVSQFVADYWMNNAIADCSVVREGLPVSQFANAFDRTRTVIGFAGRLVPEKGLVMLLEAMPEIVAQLPDIELRIAGRFAETGPGKLYQSEVEQKIADLKLQDVVYFDGFVRPLDEWLAGINLAVVPSTCDDAQPLVMLEAMSVGTPVVGTTMGGIPEVLKDGLSVGLVPELTPGSLAETVIRILGEDLPAIGNIDRSQILKEHRIEDQMQDLEERLEMI